MPRELKSFALKFQSNLMYVVSSLSKGIGILYCFHFVFYFEMTLNS